MTPPDCGERCCDLADKGHRAGCPGKPDSGEREVCGWRHDLIAGRCALPRRHEGIHEVCVAEATAIPPLSLAQRILAALEDIDTQEVRAIRKELRARLPR